MHRRSLLAAAVVVSLLGCTAEEEYVGDTPLHSFAVTADTPPFFASDEASLYIVEERVELPIEPPTDANLAALMSGAEDLPYDRMPWIELGDLDLEVDWALTNLTDSAGRVAITLNGFTEFHEYMPSFVVDDEEVIPDFAQWERDLEIEPYQTRYGTIRMEELDEVAIDLATVANGAPNPNQVVYFENQSDHDTRVQSYIPSVIAGLTGFRIGLRAQGLPDCGSATCGVYVLEVSVRVRDEDRDRLAVQGEEAWELPTPALLSSRPMMAAPAM